jgi:hypothetical protein
MSPRSRWRRAVVIAATFCSSASLAEEPRQFSGQWRRNEQLSQSALGAIEIVMGTVAPKGTGGRSRDVFSPSGILEQQDVVGLRDALVEYVRGLYSLTIVQTDDEIQVQNALNYVSLFYIDGEKHTRELRDGVRLEVIARGEGPSIWVEQKSEAGDVIQERYSLLSDGSQMAFLFRLESNLLDERLSFRIVYDRKPIDE